MTFIILYIAVLIVYIYKYLNISKYVDLNKYLNLFNDEEDKKTKKDDNILKKYKEHKNYIDNIIDIDLNSIKNNKLKEYCKYSTSDGKRIRSVIIRTLIDNENTNIQMINDSILFIEYLHASSLIMDDMMDNDKYRRNKKCLHVKYNNNIAQMTALYLMSLAWMHLSNLYMYDIDELKKRELMRIISDNFHNLCVGQFMDIDENSYEINDLMNKKTGSLFEVSFILSWYCNNENNIKLDDMKKYGLLFGKIFQISDDFNDLDKDKGKNNYVYLNGKKKSYDDLQNLIEEFKKITFSIINNTEVIEEIFEYIVPFEENEDKDRYTFNITLFI